MTISTLCRLFVFPLLFLLISSNAQTINLSGIVKNNKSTPVAGAEIRLSSNTAIHTKTDAEGKFILTGQTTITVPTLSKSKQTIAFYGSTVKVAFSRPAQVSVTAYTITGKALYHYTTEVLNPGIHTVALPTRQFGIGVYFLAVRCNGEKHTFSYVSPLSVNTNSVIYSSESSLDQAALSKRASTSQVISDTLLISAGGYKSAIYPIQAYNRSNIQITLDSISNGSRLDNITKSCDGRIPGSISGGQSGWGSRYWDCCKPHCSWPENTKRLAANCGSDNKEILCYKEVTNGYATWLEGTKSGCEQSGIAYMCYRHVPFALCEKVAYGFAAVPAGNDACGKCFQLEFDGGFKHGTPKAAHALVKGKIMIVMASNIGHDVGGGQFDLMIPGGGLGAFREGCQKQWNVDVNDESLVGKGFGGFISKCQEKLGWDAVPDDLKLCVRSMCDNLFGNKPELRDLWEGCIWYVEWMHAVDNPTFKYKEVECPAELIELYYSSHHPKP